MNDDLKQSCKILNLKINFTKKELKKNFKKIALIEHPDKGGTNFNKVMKAYKYLCEFKKIKNPLT